MNLTYSNPLMENLHPDDACQQLKTIYDALASGGRYVCIMPTLLSGPHDVSKHLDDVRQGSTSKKYTAVELARLFRTVGFSRIVA